MGYKQFSPHACKCNSFGCTAAIKCDNACRGPHSDSLYSGSEHSQFNSPRLVKREAGFPNPRRALIGSTQLWRANDSPYHTTENSARDHSDANIALGPILKMYIPRQIRIFNALNNDGYSTGNARQVIIMTFVNTKFCHFFNEIDTTLAGWCHRYVSVTDRWGVKMAVMVCVCVSHKLHHFHQPASDTLSHSKRYKTQTRELLLTAHLTVYVRHGLEVCFGSVFRSLTRLTTRFSTGSLWWQPMRQTILITGYQCMQFMVTLARIDGTTGWSNAVLLITGDLATSS